MSNHKTEILLFDRKEELITILEDGNDSRYEPREDGAFYFIEAKWLREINGEESLRVTIPADHPEAEHVVNGNKFGFFDQDGDFHLFDIVENGEEHTDEQIKIVYCEHVYNQLAHAERIGDIRPQNATAEYALGRVLENTNWEVGQVVELGLNSTNFYRESPLSAIEKIVTIWGGQLRWRIETDGQTITGRYVDLLNRRGEDRGKAFVYGENVESIERTIDDSQVKTALYCYGRGEETETGGFGRRITIAEVEWSKADGDPLDKPLGQEWIGDPDAKERYGLWQNGQWEHKYGDFEDSEEADPEELIKKGYAALQQAIKPIINYKVKAIDLEHMTDEFGDPMDHEKTRLGDTCLAINDDFKPAMREQVDIIKDIQYLGEPERREFELGNFLPLITDDNRLDDLERRFNDRVGLIDDPPRQVIEDEDFPDVIPPVPSNVEVTGLFKIIQISWDFDPSSYIASYEVYASQTQGFSPSSSNLVFRGSTGGFAFEAATNQKWYFRLRTVNRHGRASAFTDEYSASTVHVQDFDVAVGSINANKLQDLSIAAEKLADGAVVEKKIFDGAVGTEKLAELAVTTAKIADAAINSAKIADLAVGNAAIQNGAITNAKIANLAVTTAKIQDGAITNAKIEDASIDTAKIANAAITNAKIADLSADKISSGTMSANRIRGGELTLGGTDDAAGIFRLLDEQNNAMIMMNKEGIQLWDGARIMGSQGILSVFQFVSSDQWNGWSDIGLIDGPQIEKGRCSVTIPVPNNFVIEKATLTLEAMPVYYNDSVRDVTKWKQSRNLRLYKADGNDGFFDYPYPGHPWVDWRSGTNITSAVWGVSSWSPPITPSDSPTIQYRSGDVKQYLTPGEETTFYVETTDSATENNFDNNQGLGRLVVSIEGFARPEN